MFNFIGTIRFFFFFFFKNMVHLVINTFDSIKDNGKLKRPVIFNFHLKCNLRINLLIRRNENIHILRKKTYLYYFYKLNKSTLIMFLPCYLFPRTTDRYKRKHHKQA